MHKLFKKSFLLSLIISLILLASCSIKIDVNDDEPSKNYSDEAVTFTIFSINDFHGCLFENEDQAGIARIGEYVLNEKEKNPDTTLVISAGDMFQGTAISSLSRGKSVVEAMNYIGFDAMTIGNHEFDWGIEEVLKYQDGDPSNGEANFPFLVANVTDINTNKLASWATPYVVIEKAGYKFGIIGIIGSEQTNEILATYVKDYQFTNELSAIKKYTKILREEEKVDFVIVSCHCDTTSINTGLVALSGEYKIDMILNGHTHQAYYGLLDGGIRNCSVPYIQSGCYGKYLGVTTLTALNGELIQSNCINLSSSRFKEANTELTRIINSYTEEIAIASKEIGICGKTLYKKDGEVFCADAALDTISNAQIGIVNSGGIRGNAFPVNEGDMVTYGDIFEMTPFENKVVASTISGSELLRLFTFDGIRFSSNVDPSNATVNGEKVEAGKFYRVATIDYLFEKSGYPFKNGTDIVRTDIIFRDAVYKRVLDNVTRNGKFYYDR